MSWLPFFALLFGLVVLLICGSVVPPFRCWLRRNRGLLDIANTVAALGVFLSLFYTLAQFYASQEEEERQRLSVMHQRLVGLLLEIDMNLKVCDALLADKEQTLAASSVPLNLFHGDALRYFTAEAALDEKAFQQFGTVVGSNKEEVTPQNVGVTLTNAYHYLLQANDLISRSAEIMTLQPLARLDTQTKTQTDLRLKEFMKMLLDDTTKLKDTLEGVKPVLQAIDRRLAMLSSRSSPARTRSNEPP